MSSTNDRPPDGSETIDAPESENGPAHAADDRTYDLAPGDVVDERFEVDRRIGAGGMGEVYLARQLNIDRPVALKLLKRDRKQDDRAVEQFLNEATAISRLTSPHTITLHDVGQMADGSPFIAMELLDGHTLRARMARGPVSRQEALRVIDGIALSLAEAHARGIVHRDVKPSNVMLAKTPGHRAHVKVLDFGLARLAETAGEKVKVAGTPLYMAPEALQKGVVTPRTDVYALGMVAYELFAGAHPFAGRDRSELIEAQLTEVPPSLDEAADPPLPSKVAHLIARCIGKAARLRPKDAGEFRRLLRIAFDLEEEHDEEPPSGADADLKLLTSNTTAGATAGPASKRSSAQRRWILPALALVALAAFTVNRVIALQPAAVTVAPTRVPSTSTIEAEHDTTPRAPSAVVTPSPPATTSALIPPSAAPSAAPAPAPAASSPPAAPSPAKPTANRCADHWRCEQLGKCTERNGKCVLASTADCKKTQDCKSFGYCSLVAGKCVAGTDADCLGSPSCKNHGMCAASGGVCVKTSTGCAGSYDCTFHGKCAVNDAGACFANSAAKCAVSGTCKKFGACSLIRGACRAGSDADCQQSSHCREYGKCTLLGEICLKR